MSRDDHLSWFHGKVSRELAEEIVKSEGCEEGTFIVRESNTAPGDFVLTLLYQNEVCHYQIRRHGEDAFFSIEDKAKILHGLDTLVDYYQQAANGLVTKLTKYIRKDPPPNDTRSHGSTNLLHRAVLNNNHVVVSELLKCGYRNVDAKNQDGQTAMHLASLHGDENMLKLLINASVNVNCMDTDNNMPLHYACRFQSSSFIRTLIAANANVQGRNIRNGYVPLHEAAKYGNLDAVKELLAVKAPLLPRTSMGEFPIDLAKEGEYTNVVSFLETYKLGQANTFKSQWYHGTLTREEAVEVLKEFAANMQSGREFSEDNQSSQDIDTSGCFLVRFSERKTSGSGYVLTLLFDNAVKNFIISKASNYLFIDDGPFLPSLEHLVEHFMRFADGLPVNLKFPVMPKPKPPLPLFSTMPRSSHKKSIHAINVPEVLQSLNPESKQNTQNQLQALESLPSQTQKKKLKDHSNSVFGTLRLRSPKKSSLLETMGTLRKNKHKQKSLTEEHKTSKDEFNNENQLKHVETLLKDISFSTEFSSINSPNNNNSIVNHDEFYKVPKNNSAIEENRGQNDNQNTSLSISSAFSKPDIEQKTDEEVEYLTKSDLIIERERNNKLWCKSSLLSPNANGYIPTIDVRVFRENNDPEIEYHSSNMLEASAAELRELSKNPERLDSLISTTSDESAIGRYLNRQISNASSTTLQSDTACAGAGIEITKPNYLISSDCLVLEKIVGEGEFGSVYKGFLIQRDSQTREELSRREVAIKTLRDEHCRSSKQEFLREASVMIRLKHHCIIQLIGISKGETLMMVQELVSLGSMLQFILDHKEKINPNYELKLWASQIACGMHYLEQNHYVHRDLAARNILLASRNQAKISDFGLSRALGTGNECYQASQGGKWPIKWYAPESYNNGIFSHASDVWSFGVTLWEMFSLGEPPYGDILGREAIHLIENGERLPQPSLCPDYIYKIMQNCWNYKPKDRPSFRYLTDFFARDPDYQNILELIKTENIS